MKARLVSRTALIRSFGPGVGVGGGIYYVRSAGTEMIDIHTIETRSDLMDEYYSRRSADNGTSWTTAEKHPTEIPQPDGILRQHPLGGIVDRFTDRFVMFLNEGLFRSDDPLEGMIRYALRYRVSEDGGRNWPVDELIVQEGDEFDQTHPLPGLWIGKNSVMFGDRTCEPVLLDDGTILMPAQMTPVGPEGTYWNPGGGFTYHDTIVLAGRWKSDGRISWQLTGRIAGDPERTTRGLVEPTLGVLDSGRILVVMRGSNDVKPRLPGYRWFSISDDQRGTWTQAEPWTYTDGETFFSPSSCSQLLSHSSGRLFWIGNLVPTNPRGNSPRYPLVLAEVDKKSGLVVRESVSVLDDRAPGESERLTLSNFHALEDRETGELLLTLPRYFTQWDSVGKSDFTADLTLLRFSIT